MPHAPLQDVGLGEYAVPKGTPVTIALSYLAKSDPAWADATGDLHPARFSPERWLGGGAGGGGSSAAGSVGWLSSGAQMPFGAGACPMHDCSPACSPGLYGQGCWCCGIWRCTARRLIPQ